MAKKVSSLFGERIMGLKVEAWIALLVVAILLILGARYFPYFPGDVAVARFVQSVTPASPAWARWISSTAKFPWNLLLLVLTMGVSWWVVGRRAALLALSSFAGMWVLGILLGPLVGRPRPPPNLVQVVDNLSGYSFPSIFALTYASTVGYLAVLFARKASGALQIGVVASCCALMLIGWAARIALGAHWPSDVVLSYLAGFLWACFLVRFT